MKTGFWERYSFAANYDWSRRKRFWSNFIEGSKDAIVMLLMGAGLVSLIFIMPFYWIVLSAYKATFRALYLAFYKADELEILMEKEKL